MFLHLDLTSCVVDYVYFSSVLTLLKATYASPGLNLPFAGVISMTISGSVSS